MNFSENLLTIVDSSTEYIIIVNNRLFIMLICGASKNDNENIRTATAIPFGMLNVMNNISSRVCSFFLRIIFTAMNLVIIKIANITNDFIMNSTSTFNFTMNPISKNTSISSDFDNIPLNS